MRMVILCKISFQNDKEIKFFTSDDNKTKQLAILLCDTYDII